MQTLEEIKYYYSVVFIEKGKEIHDNIERVTAYSCKALEILDSFTSIDDVNDSIRDAITYYGMPDMDIHILLSNLIYDVPKAKYVKTCKKCGRAFNYENRYKHVSLKTGKLIIPDKCTECAKNNY